MSTKDLKQIGIGLLATVIVLNIADLFPSVVPSSATEYRLFGHLYVWSAVEGALFMFVAAVAGAYFARINFTGPAVLFAVGIWVFVVYIVNSIGAAAGHDDIIAVAVANILGLFFWTIAASTGAIVGRRSSKENEDNASTAA